MDLTSQDPRSSSTQSLVPDPASASAGRRRLLLVYVHGFMGNETSFRSFPAHVHNLVTITLADSHVVHTKIYPRYRSRNALELARDDFSKWLAPHEDEWTDIILLGHSMGGLLAADIALVFRHRIIGIVNFDVPFLGMHPGIVKAGLGSIFNPPPTPQDAIISDPDAPRKSSRIGTLFNPKPLDPNYNPSFSNDVQLPVRKGWENTLHWLTKHYSDGLRQATKGLVKSHFEFGSAMADYRELKDRYARVRALEEDDESKRLSALPHARSVPRIRFVNYYTTTYGRPKKPKPPKSPSPTRPGSSRSRTQSCDADPKKEQSSHHDIVSTHDGERDGTDLSTRLGEISISSESVSSSPRPSTHVKERSGNEAVSLDPEQLPSAKSPTNTGASVSDRPPNLPDIPPIPQEPPFVDLMQFSEKAQRKTAEKEHERALKEYQKAVKMRNKIINERTKLEEKWERQQQEMTAEARQRQAEAEQRQAEARQRQAEAEQRQREAEERQIGATPKTTHNTNDTPSSTQVGAPGEQDATPQLGPLQAAPPSTSSPYGHYDFSRSAILRQAPPEDVAGSATESSYTLSTTTSHSSHQVTLSSSSCSSSSPSPSSPPPPSTDAAAAKPRKLKKFCMLPPKDAQGHNDPTWVRVLMQGMDEVTAHTSLFFVNETYERLVGDVGARVEDWVREADSVRVVREMEGLK
ncbi:hypothetical protein ACN47E_008787 [Coniothyrium glycines]